MLCLLGGCQLNHTQYAACLRTTLQAQGLGAPRFVTSAEARIGLPQDWVWTGLMSDHGTTLSAIVSIRPEP